MNKDRYGLFLVLFSTVLFFFGLGWRDFWAPVEPRYAEIARVMFTRDQWIVPTVNNELYTDKPILFFWLALVASNIFGSVSEWTVRMPAALGGVGFVLSTYLFGRDFFGSRTGFISALVLATSLRVIWEARWAHVDMVFCCFFVNAVYFGGRALLRKGPTNEILLAYIFMALATLTKGLIGVVLPGLLFVSIMLARRDWRMISTAKLPLGILIFLVVAAPWFFLVSQATDGRWLADFLILHHLQRYIAGLGHRQPFYYYFTTLPVDLLPWTIFALPALVIYRPYRQVWSDPTCQFILLWFLVVFVFFSFSDTKRDLYLMPLLPPVALFIGNYLDALMARRLPQSCFSRWLTAGYFGIVALVAPAIPIAAWIYRKDAVWFLLPASFVLSVGGALIAVLLWRSSIGAAFVAAASMMTLTTVAASIWVFSYLETFKSPRSFATQINRIVPASSQLYIYADSMNDFNYYTGRESIPVLSGPPAVAALLRRGSTGYMLVKDRDLKKLPLFPQEWIVASDAKGGTVWHLAEVRNTSSKWNFFNSKK